MFKIKRCPGCGKKRNGKDKKICSKCGFDFVKLKIKCRLCGNYYEIENNFCPKCNHSSALYKIHAKDIENVKKIIKYRFLIIIALLTHTILLITHLMAYEKQPVELLIFILFICALTYPLLYHKVKKNPVVSFLLSHILLLLFIYFLIESIYNNVYFAFFIPAYTFFLINFAKAYEISWKINAKEKLKRLI